MWPNRSSVADATASIERDPGSFRDPSGFVFRRDGIIYRQIDRPYADDWAAVQAAGLLDRLIARGALIGHDEVALELAADPRSAVAVIRPEPLDVRLVPVRVDVQPAEGRRAADPRRPARGARRRVRPEGRQRVQRPVPPRATDAHRQPVVRAGRARCAVGGLPPVLRALPRPARADGLRRHPVRDDPARLPRRHPARSGEQAPAAPDPAATRSGGPHPPPRARPAALCGRGGRGRVPWRDEPESPGGADHEPADDDREAANGARRGPNGPTTPSNELRRRGDRREGRARPALPPRGGQPGRLGPRREHRDVQPDRGRPGRLGARAGRRPGRRRAALPGARRRGPGPDPAARHRSRQPEPGSRLGRPRATRR